MGLVYEVIELTVDTLNSFPLYAVALTGLLWAPVLFFVHELGHALAALVLTDGRVAIGLGHPSSGDSLRIARTDLRLSLRSCFAGGWASYDPERLWRGRHEAWIALAGPVSSFLAGVVLTALALTMADAHPTFAGILLIGGAGACGHGAFTGLPIRYAAGSGAAGAESDGMAAWRILTGGVGRSPEIRYGRSSPSEPAMSPVLAVLLGVIVVGTLVFLSVPLGLLVIGLFAVAWAFQRSDEKAGR